MKCRYPRHWGHLIGLGFALWLAPDASAQVVVELSVSEVVTPRRPAAPRPRASPPRPPRLQVDVAPRAIWGFDFLFGHEPSAGWSGQRHGRAFETLQFASPPPPEKVVLDTFDASTVSGSVRPSTTWVGQVTQNATSLAIGGLARNDNGWGASSLDLDATGMLYLNVTAQRDVGHNSNSLFLQLEDRGASTRTHIVSIDTSLFAFGAPTLAQVSLGAFSSEFLVGSIGAWSLGGGGLGDLDFRMTLHHVELSASAIPEPTTYAAVVGIGVMACALYRRRKSR